MQLRLTHACQFSRWRWNRLVHHLRVQHRNNAMKINDEGRSNAAYWHERAMKAEARLAEAERKLQHCKEQADAGLEAEHDCPAVYACASIFAELATEADRAAVSAGEPRHQTPENTADSASVVTESK